MNNEKDTASLSKDWRYVVGALALLLLANFGLNYLGSSNDLSKERAELLQSGITADKIELPSVWSESVDRTFGSVYGLVDLLNIVALVSVAGLLTFYVFKIFWPGSLAKFGSHFDEGWAAMAPTEKSRWQLGIWAALVFAFLAGRGQAANSNLALPISDEAIDLIVYYEVGGKAYYEKRLQRPTVPAWRTTASGVTVGFGVDVGHMSDAQIHTAFNGIIPNHMIRSLQSVNGLKGKNAYYNGLPKVKNSVRITWDQAKRVFERDTLPRFTKQTKDAFRLTPGRLHPHENGALTSLVFNRGPSMSTRSSRKEMRYIRYDIGRGYSGYVPGHIRAMKRLWSKTKLRGLHLRRDAEANLCAKGARLRVASR